ncbi:hypothetical protein H632_c209p2, partial [Helicosporidium sp. ATCC 50920]
ATASPPAPRAASTPILPGEESEGVYEAELLEAGVKKHILSIFVADESGLINRVAGVFARRGANIESLAVGLTRERALFTIVVTGTAATVANLCKQLAKLVSVCYVEDMTGCDLIERELLMVKVAAPQGSDARAAVQQVAESFRARVVDVADDALTLSATGDPGKVVAFQRALAKFGVLELVRTGRIALRRGRVHRDAPEDEPGSRAEERARPGEGERPRSFEAQVSTAPAPPSTSSPQGDVYSASGGSLAAPWSVRNVLEEHWDELAATAENQGTLYSSKTTTRESEAETSSTDGASASAHAAFEPYTLLIEVQDRPGVLNQVTGVIARRGYNVQSLAVGNSEREGYSRITLMVPGTERGIEALTRQICKLVYVARVTNLSAGPLVARELMLIKVGARADQRAELLSLAQIFHGSVCDVALDSVTLQVTGKEDKMRALQGLLRPYGILEIARTGRIALERPSGVDSKLLSSIAGNKLML